MKIFRSLILLLFIPFVSVSAQTLSPWTGSWTFTETWPDLSGTINDYLAYKLNIPSDSSQPATLDISGFQTFSHENLTAVITNDAISFISNKDRKARFKLVRRADVIQTQWLNLKPVLDSHKKAGIYFSKSNRRTTNN